MVLDESFSSGALDEGTWNREVQLGGFGNGEFEMTTDEEENLCVPSSFPYPPVVPLPSYIAEATDEKG
jgi:hypothetical protein